MALSPPHVATRLAHAGCAPDPVTGAVVASPVLATTFERLPDGGYPAGHQYSRSSNPTRALLEAALADLEGGAACGAFGSGMAAAHAVLASLPHGSTVVIPADVYHGVRTLLNGPLADRLHTVACDTTTAGALDAVLASGEVALVWLETPSNPLVRVTDLAACIAAARAAGALVAVDNTWPTPLLTQPLALGADFSVHSLTKYLAGHSDVLGGAVVAREAGASWARVQAVQALGGGVLDPFSCWLTLRGMRTLAVRLERACANAQTVAEALAAHPAVSVVHYPGLPTHAGHAVAARQMQLHGQPCFGAMVSFEVAAGEEAARRVASGTRVFRQATSLGGTESLIEHRRSVEGPLTETPGGLLRLSIGIEHAADLVADLQEALDG